jgi:hypothetical protein
VKNYKVIVLIAALLLIASTPVALWWFKHHQKLGTPGIKAETIPGNTVMKIELPEKVLDYTSTNLPTSEVVLGYLPPDTSYAQRRYLAPNNNFWVVANIILMGRDRSSIHKPDYCMAGNGCEVVSREVIHIPITGPVSYELPVSKWVGRKLEKMTDGTTVEKRLVYVFWFVADNVQTPHYGERNWLLVRNLLRTGVLQRWAYVSYLAQCPPGAEEACFDRMKALIAESVPAFQLPLDSSPAPSVARQ